MQNALSSHAVSCLSSIAHKHSRAYKQTQLRPVNRDVSRNIHSHTTRHHPECQRMGKYEGNIYREKLCRSCENLVDRRRNHTGKKKNVNLAEQVTFFPRVNSTSRALALHARNLKLTFMLSFHFLFHDPLRHQEEEKENRNQSAT